MKKSKEDKLREKNKSIFEKQMGKTLAGLVFLLTLTSAGLDLLIRYKKNCR